MQPNVAFEQMFVRGRGKVQTLVGNASTKTSKTFEVLVEAGEEAIAEELIKYMYSEEITLTSGIGSSSVLSPLQRVEYLQ